MLDQFLLFYRSREQIRLVENGLYSSRSYKWPYCRLLLYSRSLKFDFGNRNDCNIHRIFPAIFQNLAKSASIMRVMRLHGY